MSELRPYQEQLEQDVLAAWAAGARGVLMRLATGGGKTVVLGSIVRDHAGKAIVMAHRQELVGQLSLQLAREGVRHDVVANDKVRRECVRQHMDELGRSFIQVGARCRVASVQTLVRRELPDAEEITLAVCDEAHHYLRKNTYGKAIDALPNARLLLPTATPTRADGMGLGTHADGYADVMVAGPSMRALIDAGYLTPYRIICPKSDLDLTGVPTGASGEFGQKPLAAAARKSHLVGDVVDHYQRWAAGKTAATFHVDIQAATDTAAAFRARGITAEVLSGKTHGTLRTALMRKYRARELLVLCTVGVLGEGVDVPAMECVIDAQPTQSFANYAQKFGRMMRLIEGKEFGLYIDPVGNVERHNGPPDFRTHWTLDAREKRGKSEPSIIRICLDCRMPYLRELTACPHCGEGLPPPMERSGPEFVDGDLTEIDPAWLAERSREIARINGEPFIPQHLTGDARGGAHKQHRERREAHVALRRMADTWAACQGPRPLRELYRRFYIAFGVDMATAQTLSRPDAEGLRSRIEANIIADGFVINQKESAA